MRIRTALKWAGGLVGAAALGLAGWIAVAGPGVLVNPGPVDEGASAAQAGLNVVVVARNLDNPWGLAFLPDGRMLLSERTGQLRLMTAAGQVSKPLTGVPLLFTGGQGGLLDVAVDPDFATNRTFYFSFAEPDATDGDRAGTAVARARLEGNRLTDVAVIFRQQPKVTGGNHWGSRLVVKADESGGPATLFITLGDRFGHADSAQDLSTTLGKIVRIRADGSVPPDNPFAGRAGARPEIWSWGHRNSQGAALHPVTGKLWITEHGPRGGDELNVPAAGANHGWPVITHGRDYLTGRKLGQGTTRADVAPALHVWIPSIAPSGMAFVTSARYPGWQGDLLVGALAHRQLVRLELAGERVVREHRLLAERAARIRDVRQGPDGFLYLLTDGDAGQILKLVPR